MVKNVLFAILILASLANANAQGSRSCLHFDGVDDDVLLQDTLLNVAINFTVEGWIKPDTAAAGYNCIWEWSGLNGSDKGTHIYYVGDGGALHGVFEHCLYVNFYLDGGAQRALCTPLGSINDSDWTHFAVVRDGLFPAIYLNGVLQSLYLVPYWSNSDTITDTTGTDARSNVLLSRRFSSSTLYGKEQLDELRLWNVARTDVQIRDNMCMKLHAPFDSTLIGYWDFNNTSGDTLFDLSPHHINGTLENMNDSEWVTSGAPVGDTSTYLYTGTWAGVTVNLGSPDVGNVTASNINSNVFKGVHIYRVDTLPNTTNGITNSLAAYSSYFGIFSSERYTNFDLTYNYSGYADAVSNEPTLALYTRRDNSDTVWNDANASQDTSANNLTKTNFNSRTELMLARTNNLVAAFQSSDHSICPGSCVDFTNLSANATSYLWLFPGSLATSSSVTDPIHICYDSSGSYDVTLIATNSSSDTLILSNYITVFTVAAQSIVQHNDTLFSNQGFVTYQWYYNGNIISGATNSFYFATQNGDYNVVAADSNGCVSEATIFDVHIGIDEINAEHFFSISPNPTHANFTISTSLENAQVEIYNVLGEKIYTAAYCSPGRISPSADGLKTVDCSFFHKGIYFVKLQSEKGSAVKKLVVQ